jgi:DNA-binding SARP family transcriptional activator
VLTVEVLVLGPLAVRVEGREADLSGVMPRRLLALLAARSGRDVSADSLVEDLWQGAPPAGAAATLQSHVARLRRVLGSDAISTRPAGYRLEAAVDATVFERAVQAARSGDGADVLRSALWPWRGPAYDGLRDAAPLALEGQRLDELRLAATLECVAAEQELGRTVGHVEELEDLVRRHPVSEPLWALLLRALATEGRQADALAAYQRARIALRDELGVEPGAALRELEHRILTQDPDLISPRKPLEGEAAEQRRVVTVLALEVPDAEDETGDPEVSAVTARRLALLSVLEAHGGTLLPSPGLTAFAVVGAPLAHDDDAARAVRAAQTLLSDGIAVRAGLATGVVVADESGQPRPGPVTQRAERLAREARRGELRLDQPTRAAALAEGTPGVTGPFTGREGDLSTLRHAVDSVCGRGTPQLVTVVAEAGMGKSRLCQELLAGLDEDAVLVRRAVCPAYGEAAGLRVVGALIGHDPGRAEEIGSRDDAFERWITELRTDAGGRALLLLVDDLHWADELVTGFLHHALTEGSPVLVVVAARPEVHRRHPTWGHGVPAATTLHLSPLSDDDVAALVGAVLTTVDDATRHRIVDQAGGVPLHALELGRLAGTSGALDPGATLSGVLSARLDTLTPRARDAVVDASVIGKTFPVGALVTVSGRPLAEIQADLRELAEREFVRRIASDVVQPAVEREYVFTHDLVRAAAYARLLRRDAARRHVTTVTWAEGHRSQDVAFLAHHAGRAHDLADAVGDAELAAAARGPAFRYAYEAGTAVLGLDTTVAIRLLTRAVELADPGSHDLARAQCRLGQALFDNGRFADAAPYLRASQEGLEGVPDSLRLQGSMWEMWNNFALGRDLDAPAREMAVLIEALPRSVDTAVALGALGALSVIQQTPESLRRAIAQADEAVEVAEEVGHPERSGLARAVRGRARLGLGDAGGLQEMDGALADLSRWEMGSYQVAFYIWRAGALHHWRGPAEELSSRQDMETVAERRGLGYMTSFSVAEEVRCLAELGRLREAITLAGTVNPDEAQPRWAVVARALALADLGELDARTVAEVAATPPASDDDLRHVVGKVLVAGTWRPSEVPELLAGLGGLTPYAERDGAVELLPRLVRMALDAGCAEAVAGLPDLSGLTPLSQAIGPHVQGLLSGDADLLVVAVERWKGLGHATEHALALLDLAEATQTAEARRTRAAEAAAALRTLGMRPWAERAGRA